MPPAPAAVAALLFALLAGCTSPPSRFYTLSATQSPAAPPSPLTIAVGPVSIPAAVDRPEMVVTSGPNQVSLQEFERWASPLDDEIARVVAENLSTLLGAPRVTQADQGTNRDAAYRVAIEVQRFDSNPGQGTALSAVWTVRRATDDRNQGGRTDARVPASGPGFDAVAAAHSRALAQLSQDIAAAVQALERQPIPAPPLPLPER